MWRIEYSDIAAEALLRLDKPIRKRILDYMKERISVSSDPKDLAEPLKGELRGLWRFRVGAYRIISDIQESVEIVEVLDLGHRSSVYRKTGR